MLSTRVIIPLALASAAFLWGCQEQASSPTGPEGSSPQFTHKGDEKPHGGPKGGGSEDDPTEPVTWSEAELVVGEFVVSDVPSTLVSSCPGTPGAQTSNPSVEWKNGEGNPLPKNEDCVMVMPLRTDEVERVTLTNDASLIVAMATKKGITKVTVQFLIQSELGSEGIQYRTDRFVVDNNLNGPFTGAAGEGFILHVHSTVPIWKLKGHTGGPKVGDPVGTIHIGDIVYN